MKGKIMSVSTALLGLGLTMTGLGTVMLLLSFSKRGKRENSLNEAAGVIFIGPIPIVLAGRGKWVLVGIAAAVVIILLMAAVIAQPDIIGW